MHNLVLAVSTKSLTAPATHQTSSVPEAVKKRIGLSLKIRPTLLAPARYLVPVLVLSAFYQSSCSNCRAEWITLTFQLLPLQIPVFETENCLCSLKSLLSIK